MQWWKSIRNVFRSYGSLISDLSHIFTGPLVFSSLILTVTFFSLLLSGGFGAWIQSWIHPPYTPLHKVFHFINPYKVCRSALNYLLHYLSLWRLQHVLIILHGQILGHVFWEEEEHEMPRIFLFSFWLWSLGPGKGVFCKSVFLVVSFRLVDLKEMQWSLWDHMLARWLCSVIMLNLLVPPTTLMWKCFDYGSEPQVWWCLKLIVIIHWFWNFIFPDDD
jgi:hypothetical protein